MASRTWPASGQAVPHQDIGATGEDMSGWIRGRQVRQVARGAAMHRGRPHVTPRAARGRDGGRRRKGHGCGLNGHLGERHRARGWEQWRDHVWSAWGSWSIPSDAIARLPDAAPSEQDRIRPDMWAHAHII